MSVCLAHPSALGALVVLCGVVSAAAQDAVVLDSGKPGPDVLVIGGIHGNEPSGALAAETLARGRPPSRGRLRVLAEANPEALAAGERSAPRLGAKDLNRVFPGQGEGVDDQRAAAIFAQTEAADLVLDLHEEGSAWLEADLPTLVVSPAAAAFAMDLLEVLKAEGCPFAFTGGAPAGSLVGELGALGKMALVVEVPARLPRRERVRLHLLVAEATLGLLHLR